MDKWIEEELAHWVKPLYGFALGRTRHMDEAEELAARMAEGLCRSLARTGRPECLEAYVWRLAQNQFSRWLAEREKGRDHVSFDENSHDGDGRFNPEDMLVREETMGLLRREIAWLSRIQRQVVVLNYFESRSTGWIARELGLPEGTIRWHLHAARQELRRGMDIMRSVGTLGIKPVEFKCMGHWGIPGPRGDTAAFLGRSLTQNIVYACFRKDLTVEEISAELGVSPVFVVDEIKELADFGFLEPRKAGTYRCQVYIDEWDPRRMEALTALYREYAPQLARAWCMPLFDKEKDFAETGLLYPDQDFNTLLWSLVTWGLSQRFWEDTGEDGNVGRFWIDRPDGGRFIASALLWPDMDSSAETAGVKDPGLLARKYQTCGDMTRESRPGSPHPWQSWQLDTFWDSRTGAWTDCKDTDFELVMRHIRGDLSESFNVDEYRRLLDKGYLRKEPAGFSLNIIVAPSAQISSRAHALVHYTDDAAKALIHAFNQAALNLITPGYPEHMQPAVRAMNGNRAGQGLMRAFILDYLVQEGLLKLPREEHESGLNTIIWAV